MTPKALSAFCLIMRRGSLAAAANDMNLSQPAVSRLISNLEYEIGFGLFNRDKRTLTPTEEARLFFREAERVLAGMDQLSSVAEDIRLGTGRQLRVVAMSRLANSILTPATQKFMSVMPDVALTLETHHRREMGRWLTSGQFDVGFGALPINNLKLDVRPLGSTQAVAVLPAEHPFARQDVLGVADLVKEPLIALTHDTLLQQQIEAIFSTAAQVPKIGLRASSSLIACNLAAQGLGYTITDPFTASIIRKPIATRPIVPEFPLEFGVLTPSGTIASTATEVFVDCMRSAFESLSVTS